MALAACSLLKYASTASAELDGLSGRDRRRRARSSSDVHQSISNISRITPLLSSSKSSKMRQEQRDTATDVEMVPDVGSAVGHNAGWREDVIGDLSSQAVTLHRRPASSDGAEHDAQTAVIRAAMRQDRGLSDSHIYASSGALRGLQGAAAVRPVVAQGSPMAVRRSVPVPHPQTHASGIPAARPADPARSQIPRPPLADKTADMNNNAARITSVVPVQQQALSPMRSRGAAHHDTNNRATQETPASAIACSSNDSTTAYMEFTHELGNTDEEASCKGVGFSFSQAKLPLAYTQSYVYRPISYPDHSSPNALAMANNIMTRLTIPGEIRYKTVQYGSKLYQQGTRFGFTAFAICLGSSYFQRLIASMPHLEYAVRRAGPLFGEYVACMDHCSERRLALLHAQYGGQYRQSTPITEEATLASIQYACIYLATKMVDRMPMLEMLRYILTHLYGSVVSKAQAYDVESKCLEGLQFRLGPYFLTDVLEDDWPY